MRPRHVLLHIDKIVLDGLAPQGLEVSGAGISSTLRSYIMARGLPETTSTNIQRDLVTISSDVSERGTSLRLLDRRLAKAVYDAISVGLR